MQQIANLSLFIYISFLIGIYTVLIGTYTLIAVLNIYLIPQMFVIKIRVIIVSRSDNTKLEIYYRLVSLRQTIVNKHQLAMRHEILNFIA